MENTDYVDCTMKDRLKKKLTVSLAILGVGCLFLFIFAPLAILFFIAALMSFFIGNPGEIKGNCPVCGKEIMGYKKSAITACDNCRHEIRVDHQLKQFIATDIVR